ncbi:MAG: DUF4417 domain-containing protein [Ruminococcus sp.]|nr:DUF4417 domain-containing protein [Ruminococcus sp.]
MTSVKMRNDPRFMRNGFSTSGKWDIPAIKKQTVPLDNLRLIPCSDTRSGDKPENRACGVHFFVDDYRFTSIYNYPERSLKKFSQYAFLLTPDYSAYNEMDHWRQLESVAHSRWVGAFWQSKGLTVIPSVTWSDARSCSFCFDGIEKNSVVAVATIGCKSSRLSFMRGYNAMLERIEPSAVICCGKPFPEMDGSLIEVPYSNRGRRAK